MLTPSTTQPLTLRKYNRVKPVADDKQHQYFRTVIRNKYREPAFHDAHLEHMRTYYYRNIYSSCHIDRWIEKIKFSIFT